MASVVQNKRTSESKFVSICADGSDGTPDVDISFKEPLLGRPSDHYMVGVDNLTVNMNHLSMLRQSEGPDDYVFRIGRFSNAGNDNQYDPLAGLSPVQQIIAGGVGDAEDWADILGAPNLNTVEPFLIEQNYQTFNQLALAVNEYISVLNEKVFSVALADGYLAGGYNIILPTAGNPPGNQALLDSEAAIKHLTMSIGPDGRLRIIGSRAFWANYFIYVPKPEYQYMLMGRKMSQPFISLDADGNLWEPVAGQLLAELLYNPVPIGFVAYDGAQINAATTAAHLAYRNKMFQMQFGANLLSSSDRRISLELGTSLPIINNPMVDHNKVHPDYTVGRWMWNPRAQLNSAASGLDLGYRCLAPAIHEFQNSTDRVQYHSLMPQDKITFLRVKLYCRVRVYDEDKDRFSMEQLIMPMALNDWWHCRLHFVSKD